MKRRHDVELVPRRWKFSCHFNGWHSLLSVGIQSDLRLKQVGLIVFGLVVIFGRQIDLKRCTEGFTTSTGSGRVPHLRQRPHPYYTEPWKPNDPQSN
jgi:hypothetical protein